ncbi:response regulator [Microvirga sp. TS319]|uniref:response regulator n=1 Tax=Microvirga sp. TS319 TaxID=3241165 RepID=UPI00351A638E
MTDPANKGALARCRVLVVEDEYFIADDMAKALEKLGAEVVGLVPKRDKALMLLSSGEGIDAAVLDINLRGEEVFPVADALAERGIPFVFATGYDPSSVPVAYADVPRWAKPFDPDALAQTLPGIVRCA